MDKRVGCFLGFKIFSRHISNMITARNINGMWIFCSTKSFYWPACTRHLWGGYNVLLTSLIS